MWTVWELWSGNSWTVGVWMVGLRAGELTARGVEGGESSMNELTRYRALSGKGLEKLSETRLMNGFDLVSISDSMSYEWYNLLKIVSARDEDRVEMFMYSKEGSQINQRCKPKSRKNLKNFLISNKITSTEWKKT